MKYYTSDVTSCPQIGSGNEGDLWAQEITLSASTEASPWAVHTLGAGLPPSPSQTQAGLAQSSGLSTVLDQNQPPHILHSASGGNDNEHPLTPPVCPQSTESLWHISCYDTHLAAENTEALSSHRALQGWNQCSCPFSLYFTMVE